MRRKIVVHDHEEGEKTCIKTQIGAKWIISFHVTLSAKLMRILRFTSIYKTRFYERSDWTEMVGKRVRIQNVVKSTREERIQWLKRKKERNIKKGINEENKVEGERIYNKL